MKNPGIAVVVFIVSAVQMLHVRRLAVTDLAKRTPHSDAPSEIQDTVIHVYEVNQASKTFRATVDAGHVGGNISIVTVPKRLPAVRRCQVE
jgi:hypothetical protein